LAAFLRLQFYVVTFMTQLINKIAYIKQPLTYAEQIKELQNKGMIITDIALTEQVLARISYYRLSGYWHYFRQKNNTSDLLLDTFCIDTKFESILALYEFDQELRSHLLFAIEKIEIAIRTQFIYHLGHTYGAFGYVQPSNFHPQFANNKHANWLKKLTDEVLRSKDIFLNHYQNKYEGYPIVPIWMLTEVMTLGSLSYGYHGLQNNQKIGTQDKQAISIFFDLHHKRLDNWLHVLTYIRNICAHHGRLWNRELSIKDDVSKDANWSNPITPRNDKIFYVLLMVRYLLNKIGDADRWTQSMTHLLKPICQNTQFRNAMGIPENWLEHPLWKIKKQDE
jgi:abortive infection bacteriophage resistance protein